MILLISCEKYKIRIPFMIQRWISYLKKTPYVIAIGKPDLEKPFEFDEDTRILFIKCLDNYDSLSSKVYGAICAIKELWNPEFIIKIDDDVCVKTEVFEQWIYEEEHFPYEGNATKFIKEQETPDHYKNFSQHTKRYPDDFPTNIRYCGGPMYYLNREAIDILVKYMKPYDILYEDLNVGYTLQMNGINAKGVKIYSNEHNCFFNENDYFAWHDIKCHSVPKC